MSTVYINNRGRQHKQINDYLQRQNIPHEHKRLNVGDYQSADRPIAVTVFNSVQDFVNTIQDSKGHFWKQHHKVMTGKKYIYYFIECTNINNVSLLSLAEFERYAREGNKNIKGLYDTLATAERDIAKVSEYSKAHLWFVDKRDVAAFVQGVLERGDYEFSG